MRMLLATKRTIKVKQLRLGYESSMMRTGRRMKRAMGIVPKPKNVKTHKQRKIEKLIACGIMEPLEKKK